MTKGPTCSSTLMQQQQDADGIPNLATTNYVNKQRIHSNLTLMGFLFRVFRASGIWVLQFRACGFRLGKLPQHSAGGASRAAH